MRVERGPLPAGAIQEAKGPAGKPPRWHPLLVVPAAGAVYATILSPRFSLYDTHWGRDIKERFPCLRPAPCPGCEARFRPVTYAFAAGWELPAKRQVTVAIPQSAWTESPSLLGQMEHARGLNLKLLRTKELRNAPMKVLVQPYRTPEEQLPQGWDVRADLLRRWGYDTVTLFDPGSGDQAEAGEGRQATAGGHL